MFSFAESLSTGASTYFARYFLGDTGFTAMMSFMLNIPALVGMLFMQPVYRRFGKVAPMILGAGIFVIGSIVIALDPSNIYLAAAGAILRGIGRISIFGAIWGTLPDTIEYGEWKNGRRSKVCSTAPAAWGRRPASAPRGRSD